MPRFYEILEEIRHQVGGDRLMSECHGRLAWPDRGVYFFFEPTERRQSDGFPQRVVRVGTHALVSQAKSTLWGRLSQHRGNAFDNSGNHRSSVFREVIGGAIARRDGLEIEFWGQGNSPTALMFDLERALELRVSTQIGAMRLLWLDIPDAPGKDSLRGYVERNSIALLSNFERIAIDPSSDVWLGRHSERARVRGSGLWNSNHVDERYDTKFIDLMADLVKVKQHKRAIVSATTPDAGSVPRATEATSTKIVIQCAKSKMADGFLRDESGRRVIFVADPDNAPPSDKLIFAHPDGVRPDGRIWRDYLVEYNALKRHNPDGLYAAIDLYTNGAYFDLKDAFGPENIYVLSAGWGLVRGDFLLPNYDITFSLAGQVTPFVSRTLHPRFRDLNMLDMNSRDELAYVGGRDYLQQFLALTNGYAGRRLIFYNTASAPFAPGCILKDFGSEIKQNWHYNCAHALAQARRDGSTKPNTEIGERYARDVCVTGQSETLNVPPKTTVKRKVGGKYGPLFDFLNQQPAEVKHLTLKYDEIEGILAAGLPPSAIKYAQMWWANSGHTQSDAWISAGFRVDDVRPLPTGAWVRFVRDLTLFPLNP